MDRQYDFAALEALLKKRSFKALREALLELNDGRPRVNLLSY